MNGAPNFQVAGYPADLIKTSSNPSTWNMQQLDALIEAMKDKDFGIVPRSLGVAGKRTLSYRSQRRSRTGSCWGSDCARTS